MSSSDLSNGKTVLSNTQKSKKSRIKFIVGEKLTVSISSIECLFPLL